MKQPNSTYRLQLSHQFTFEKLIKILDYLNDLGISTIYASPFFRASTGSTHGYDVLNPHIISSEIGTLEEFKKINEYLKKKNMSWLQDIVPNHMAFSPENPWLKDIFELGPNSRYYDFFDINWEYKGLQKVMTPILGNSLEEVLDKGEITIGFDTTGFSLNYFENKYPLSAKTYSFILEFAKDVELDSHLKLLSKVPENWEHAKEALLREIQGSNIAEGSVKNALRQLNTSQELLKKILDLQYFYLTHWQKTETEINYRRFFTINSLICLRMEDPKVLENYHSFIKELREAGLINGVRIDHIDGLFDPRSYLQQLRKLLDNEFFIIVEKILEADEKLPEDWPVQGTSGYEFLALINQLFTRSSSEAIFNKEYEKISPKFSNYEALVYNKKLFILRERMGGELHNLWEMLVKFLPPIEKLQELRWKEALSAILAAFPVYRFYPKLFPLSAAQNTLIDTAYAKALEEIPKQKQELDFLSKLFKGNIEGEEKKIMFFLQRCQQFSGPVTAKGVEDTSFYIYNRLVAHNEVGDSPENFGIPTQEFHEKMLERQKIFPNSISATATHDTKRGEDARMRLSVLSEIPEEWFSIIEQWKGINKKVRKNDKIPGDNEEYFIYQTLVAGMPFHEENDFLSRTCDYLQKVLREAKVNSNWASPEISYEETVFEFIKNILDFDEFRESFDIFSNKVSRLGAIKSLGQSLIKITAPGIPDTYQGTELWDLSFVDPDNRRPVDYDLRKKYISEFKNFNTVNLNSKIKDLIIDYSSGKIKMYTVFKALTDRKENTELYNHGAYIPLKISGKAAGNFICFARSWENGLRIIAAPLLSGKVYSKSLNEIDIEYIKDSFISIPRTFSVDWFNIFTGKNMHFQDKIMLTDLFETYPVAMLKNKL